MMVLSTVHIPHPVLFFVNQNKIVWLEEKLLCASVALYISKSELFKFNWVTFGCLLSIITALMWL